MTARKNRIWPLSAASANWPEKHGVKMSEIALALAVGEGSGLTHRRCDEAQYLDDAAAALTVKITDEEAAYLEEPYVPHAIVGAVDHNPPQGVMLLDEKK